MINSIDLLREVTGTRKSGRTTRMVESLMEDVDSGRDNPIVLLAHGVSLKSFVNLITCRTGVDNLTLAIINPITHKVNYIVNGTVRINDFSFLNKTFFDTFQDADMYLDDPYLRTGSLVVVELLSQIKPKRLTYTTVRHKRQEAMKTLFNVDRADTRTLKKEIHRTKVNGDGYSSTFKVVSPKEIE